MIGETWTVDEILDAQSLDDLEGAGQAKRLTARLCAEVHNAIRMAGWSIHGKEGSEPPARIDEGLFLPIRKDIAAEKKSEQARQQQIEENMRSVMMTMCGY